MGGKVELQKTKNEFLLINLICVLFVVLLLMRDTFGIGINKYIFILLTLVIVATVDLPKLICFIAFIMPLYVGLPGNYMTMIFLVRCFFSPNEFKIKFMAYFSAFLVASYFFIQCLIFGHTSFAHLSFVPSIFLVLLIFSYSGNINFDRLNYSYVCGVAVTGLIMLISTLQNSDLSDLMTSTQRLGNGSADFAGSDAMKVSLDPNYFGLLAISAITSSFYLVYKKMASLKKVMLIAAMSSCLCVALVGLSRSFLICLFIWIALMLVSQKKASSLGFFILILVIGFILVSNFMPDVVEGLTTRFNENDIATANNRTTAITDNLKEWFQSSKTMVFGVGMYNCNVHCMTLQYLFGGGIIFISLMIWFVTMLKNGKSNNKLIDYLPLITTFIMSCTVPIATSLTFMFPMVIIAYNLYNNSKGCLNEQI